MLGILSLFLVCIFYVNGLAEPPHIWVVMVDDLGWNGVGFTGNNKEVKTPYIDDLAINHGVRFDHHYVYQFCSPSRASFLTGRTVGHGIQQHNLGQTEATSNNENITMIGRKLKDAGYITHAIGKWHQGFYKPSVTPHGRGFDTFYGFLGGGEDHLTQCHACENAIPDPDWATEPFMCPASFSPCNVTCPEQGGVDFYGTDGPMYGHNTTANVYLYQSEITKRVREAANEPKDSITPRFAFISLHNVHQPVEAPEQLVNLYPKEDYNESNYARRVYNGMLSGVELVVHNLTEELKAGGLWENSIILFLGDNGGTYEHEGPVSGVSNYPLRGHKYTYFEGGVRTASFLASPLLPERVVGTWSHALLHESDWWPTFAALAGLSPTDDAARGNPGYVSVDGRNAWAVITDDQATLVSDPWRTELLLGVDYFPDQQIEWQGALINGSFKYISPGHPGGLSAKMALWSAQYPGTTETIQVGPSGAPDGLCDPGLGCLFDLAADPRETNNLVYTNMTLLKSMANRYLQLAKELYAPNSPDDPIPGQPLSETRVILEHCQDDACWERRGFAIDLEGKPVPDYNCPACVKMKEMGGYWSPWVDVD